MENDSAPHTRFYIVRLPKVERFACSKKDIQKLFNQNVLGCVSLGGLGKKFDFGSRCHHRPTICGQIIAGLTVTRDNSVYLCLYSIRKETYPTEAAEVFKTKTLLIMSSWLNKKLKRFDTEFHGHETLLIEWVNKKHKTHEITY